ncbi:hypothetical protein BDV37DRAFT_181401 [Aspergillus pseudonomiae]|uniref:Uncharacterized protein n=1 Tax=Aspergillus pseudonomiae TaxID=1506151 RepID=A0A5N7D671_9EURO|nr:uncharacterized protein BDV37DRAFT_181401 [Aspergillus pseudonomiae]KAE8401403.1 hypothetical protein BDV37DRAFT_181401 [Aspergillus pseudonomiae]
MVFCMIRHSRVLPLQVSREAYSCVLSVKLLYGIDVPETCFPCQPVLTIFLFVATQRSVASSSLPLSLSLSLCHGLRLLTWTGCLKKCGVSGELAISQLVWSFPSSYLYVIFFFTFSSFFASIDICVVLYLHG